MEPAPLSSSDDLANPLLENTDEGTELASGTELVDADGAELREAHPLVADAEAQRARPPSPTTSSPSRASMASVAAAPDALREGLVVELWHARRRYAAAGSHEHLARYLSRFVAGTWCRCVVEDFDGETYTLRYEDGPHAARSRAFAPVAGLPRGTRFVRCPRDCIEVDYEASYCAVSPEGRYALSHGVVVVPFIVAAQLFCYFYYAARECERTGRAIEAYAPVAGPGGDRFAFAATSHFPGCRDLRGREWYRFWTYQWLHEGWAHVSTNGFMALVFGIPLEVAHGGWRAALIMQAGVVAGALSCAVFDVERRVVGASASCYALLGAHVAIIALHWRSMKRGLLHRDVRIAVFAALAFCDVLTTADRAANVGAASAGSVSYSAHVGGLACGYLLGVLVIQRRPVKDPNVGGRRKAAAGVALLALLCGALAWIGSHAPPKNVPWLYPDSNDWSHRSCCSKLDACADLEGPTSLLSCDDRTELALGRTVARSCNELRALLRNATDA